MATETYFTAAELKAHLRVTDNTEDAFFETFRVPASRAVDTICHRRFWLDDSTSTRKFRPLSYSLCYIDDCTTPTVVATDDGDTGTASTTWASTDYITEPDNGVGPNGASGFPVTALRAVEGRTFPCTYRPAVHVTAKWGWAAVPSEVKQASLIVAAELYAMGTVPLGAAGFADLGVIRVRDNPKVAALLGQYVKMPKAGLVL